MDAGFSAAIRVRLQGHIIKRSRDSDDHLLVWKWVIRVLKIPSMDEVIQIQPTASTGDIFHFRECLRSTEELELPVYLVVAEPTFSTVYQASLSAASELSRPGADDLIVFPNESKQQAFPK